MSATFRRFSSRAPTPNAAALLTSDVDERDHPFLTGERTPEGFFRVRAGIDQAIARGLSYAPYADMLWCETSTPDLAEAKKFAERMHAEFPGKLLAYNCSPSFNWKTKLDRRNDREIPARARRDGLTNSSSSPWPDSTRSTTACSNSRAAIAIAAWRPIPNCRKRSSRPKPTATLRPSISAKSAPDISTMSPRSSPAAKLRPRLCAGSTEEEQFH